MKKIAKAMLSVLIAILSFAHTIYSMNNEVQKKTKEENELSICAKGNITVESIELAEQDLQTKIDKLNTTYINKFVNKYYSNLYKDKQIESFTENDVENIKTEYLNLMTVIYDNYAPKFYLDMDLVIKLFKFDHECVISNIGIRYPLPVEFVYDFKISQYDDNDNEVIKNQIVRFDGFKHRLPMIAAADPKDDFVYMFGNLLQIQSISIVDSNEFTKQLLKPRCDSYNPADHLVKEYKYDIKW